MTIAFIYFTYDRNTTIMMRFKVNYLVIVPPIMVCLILNYLLIAPPKLKCSTPWITQTSVASWTLHTKSVIECHSQRNYLIVAPPRLKCRTEWIDHLMSMNWNIQESVTSWTVQTNEYTLVERLSIESLIHQRLNGSLIHERAIT